jgi:hypothetical protein
MMHAWPSRHGPAPASHAAALLQLVQFLNHALHGMQIRCAHHVKVLFQMKLVLQQMLLETTTQ